LGRLRWKLFPEHDVLDAVCVTCGAVATDDGSAHLGIAFGGFELSGHSGEEAPENEFGFDTDDGVVRAGHSDVGLVGGASGEDPSVGGGDVGVGPEYGGYAAVEIPAEGDLFARGLGVEVEEDDFGSDLAKEFVCLAEGIVAGGHEDAALEIDDGVALSSGEFAFVDAEARGSDGEVGGAEDAAAAFVRVRGDGHVLEDLFFVPDVVTGGDDVGAEIEDLLGDGGGDTEATGCVFTVDDQEFDGVGFEDVRQVFAYDVAAGGAEDVADEKNVHKKDAITRNTAT